MTERKGERALSVRGLTDEDWAALEELAKQRDWSLDKTARHLIRAALERRVV